MHRRDTVEIFRSRLQEVIERSGMSRSAFARSIGTDRSTLSQLLAADGTRLPRAETIAAIAAAAQVSVDWLLGLSAEGQMGTDVLNEAVAIEPGAASPADERLRRWHAEAAGYKIRYVPTTLPDLLKSEDVIRYEYRQHDTLEPEGRIEQAEAKLAYSRRPETDIEVCSSYQSVAQFARGHGEWEELDVATRTAQLETMIGLLDELYPTFRWFLYDLRQCYSVPFTVFGPQRVAIYIGDMWLVTTSQEHVRVFTNHFDSLIRAAVMQPPEVIEYLQRLLGEVTGGDRSVRPASSGA
ncbi:MAG: helix-turn-helix domain-containing protein [Gammaproteobacteria bacterium]|nr:helix-turn-helix domain-containing protein [Gammaproteobacteria bacterium]NIM74869.1 helix-turn-helix domain-containing protein [Gammaproteobacteria bacterium]NIN39461.1 helix-turn-helix domain-containing protein [Gammaproteobacteria bacterium]NIO26787.1 helix-turn-helix domain-containing protein [Gammaproteobacteria bacterium]NIO67343.1 helix-turn-helix domain-containing protein [Gammaproteobacteria bacterium]